MKLIHRVLSLFSQAMLLLLLTTACNETRSVSNAHATGAPISNSYQCPRINAAIQSMKNSAISEVKIPFKVTAHNNTRLIDRGLSFSRQKVDYITCNDTQFAVLRASLFNKDVFQYYPQMEFNIYIPSPDYTYGLNKYTIISDTRNDNVQRDLTTEDIKVKVNNNIVTGERYWFMDSDGSPAVLLCNGNCKTQLSMMDDDAGEAEPNPTQSLSQPNNAGFQQVRVLKPDGTEITAEEQTSTGIPRQRQCVDIIQPIIRGKSSGSYEYSPHSCEGIIKIQQKPKLRRSSEFKAKVTMYDGTTLKTSCTLELRYTAPATNWNQPVPVILQLQGPDINNLFTATTQLELAPQGTLQLAFKEDKPDCLFAAESTPAITTIKVSDIKTDGTASITTVAYPSKPTLHVIFALGKIKEQIPDLDLGAIIGPILAGIKQQLGPYNDVKLYTAFVASSDAQLTTPYTLTNTSNIPELTQNMVTLSLENKPISDLSVSQSVTAIATKTMRVNNVSPKDFYLFIGSRAIANELCSMNNVPVANPNEAQGVVTLEFYNEVPERNDIVASTTIESKTPSAFYGCTGEATNIHAPQILVNWNNMQNSNMSRLKDGIANIVTEFLTP